MIYATSASFGSQVARSSGQLILDRSFTHFSEVALARPEPFRKHRASKRPSYRRDEGSFRGIGVKTTDPTLALHPMWQCGDVGGS